MLLNYWEFKKLNYCHYNINQQSWGSAVKFIYVSINNSQLNES